MRRWFFLATCFYTSFVIGQSAGERLQEKLNNLQKMTANFHQTVYAGQQQMATSGGKIALLRPGRLRWHVQTPMEQLIIADGQHLWVYDVELEQVTVKKQQHEFSGTSALFLNGFNDKTTISRDFKITEVINSKQQQFYLSAKSTKEHFQRVQLTFDTNKLTKIEFSDQLGQHTVINLTHVISNTHLPLSLFVFKTPNGVDVIQQ